MDHLTGKIKSFDKDYDTITFEILRKKKTNKWNYNNIETLKISKRATQKKLDPSIIDCHILVYVMDRNINNLLGTYQINKNIKYEAESQNKL